MLRAILNKSWRQYPTRHQLYSHLPPIMKTIQASRTRHAGHCWRSRDELISDVLLWTPTYGRGKAGQPAQTYIQQLCEDTGCSPEDLPEARNDREKWRERVRDICASSTTWWWWWLIIWLIVLSLSPCNVHLLFCCIVTLWVGYIHIYVYTRVCVCAPIPVCVCVYVYMYMCVCAHTHTHLHACTHAHTYTHIYMWRDELDSAWVSNFKC